MKACDGSSAVALRRAGVIVIATIGALSMNVPDAHAGGGVMVAGGLANGYQYAHPTELPNVGVSIRNGFGQSGIGVARVDMTFAKRASAGLAIAASRYGMDFGGELDPGVVVTERKTVTVLYGGPSIAYEVAKSDELHWRILASVSAGVAVQKWHIDVDRSGAEVLDETSTASAFAASCDVLALRKIGRTFGLVVGGGGVASGAFRDLTIEGQRTDTLGLRQVYALAGVEWEF